MQNDIVIKLPCGEVLFTPHSGGMPEKITVREFDRETVIASGVKLSLDIRDRGVVYPAAGKFEPLRFTTGNGAEALEFTDMLWQDENGNIVPELHLGLRYEFFPDGAVFCSAIFHAETAHPAACKDFKLTFSLDFSSFDDCRFAMYPRLGSGGAVDIQRIAAQRFVPAGKDIECPGNLPIEYSFNLFRKNGPALYAEVFLESGAVLDGGNEQGSGSIRWQNGSPVLEWNFQTAETTKNHRPLQWRNRWGWKFVAPETKRKLPPQHCYQFIDNYRHYPTADELETIARSGCTMLILHSNWRRDAANGSVPYDWEKFCMVRDMAAKHGISLLLYMRGSEKEIVENSGEWFPRLLDPERDGLYMDYAGPMSRQSPPEEFACGGTVLYYQHYLTQKHIRENLGEKGLLIGHTGAWFSNCAINFSDAYISGEGERGQLLSGRCAFEYFTMAAAAPGSLWSAAFPEYATTAMIPFIASAGQFPHSPLGMQFASSSLLHPPEPGINDAVFRPLWRMWRLFSFERNVTVYNDYNCCGIFSGTENIGHYLMISDDGRRALLVLSDFGGRGNVSVDWARAGFDLTGKKCFMLTSDMTAPAACEIATPAEFAADFTGYPACAYFITPDDLPSTYLQPYPATGDSGKKYLAHVENQRLLRQVGTTAKAVLRLRLDDKICTALEDSMVIDLYDETIELGIWENDTFRVLGIITPAGLVPADTPDTPRIMPGDVTADIDLTTLLTPGKYRLGVKSNYMGDAFYNFVCVQLDTDHGTRELEFSNQLESDRAFINWNMEISEQ